MNRKKTGKLLLVLFFFCGLHLQVFPQSLNYAEIFGNDWQKALSFVEENDLWIKPLLQRYKIPYDEAIAIVFPELVRYSAIRDKMEITMLKTLYRNLGNDYADFSVGVFQIKPSFAEKIRDEAPAAMGWKAKTFFKKRSFYINDNEYRSSIISDLENPQSEFNYIIAFLMICEKQFEIDKSDEVTRIRFLATAYNSGFWKSREEIEKMTGTRFFNTKLFKTENYSYADVALFWYNQKIQSTINSQQ